MTARQVLESIQDPALQPAVAAFTDLYEQARFGGATGKLAELYALLSRVQSPTAKIQGPKSA